MHSLFVFHVFYNSEYSVTFMSWCFYFCYVLCEMPKNSDITVLIAYHPWKISALLIQ